MIRNVVLGRLRDSADAEQAAADAARLDEALTTLAALTYPGLVRSEMGRDIGLREGGWSFAITNDWTDAVSYHGYDADPEHNRVRRELVAPICAELARVQFTLPD